MKQYTTLNDLPLAMNAKDVMTALGISRSGVYKLYKEKDFPTVKVGTRIIVPKDKFILWLDRRAGETHELVS